MLGQTSGSTKHQQIHKYLNESWNIPFVYMACQTIRIKAIEPTRNAGEVYFSFQYFVLFFGKSMIVAVARLSKTLNIEQ